MSLYLIYIVSLYLNGNLIHRVQFYWYLGLWVSENMSWDIHVDHVRKRSSLPTVSLQKMYHFNRRVKLSIYKTYIRPLLKYATPVFNGHVRGFPRKCSTESSGCFFGGLPPHISCKTFTWVWARAIGHSSKILQTMSPVQSYSRPCTSVPKTTASAFCESVHPIHSPRRGQFLNSAHEAIVY